MPARMHHSGNFAGVRETGLLFDRSASSSVRSITTGPGPFLKTATIPVPRICSVTLYPIPRSCSAIFVLRSDTPVQVNGGGVIECFAWQTQAGYALHLLNYTNPNMHKGWIRNFYPLGEQKVQLRVPDEERIASVELLRAERQLPFRQRGSTVEFTVPEVLDYEVAALNAS